MQFIYPNALGSIMHQYSYTLGSIICSIWYNAQFVTAHLSAVSVSHRHKHSVIQEQAQCHTGTGTVSQCHTGCTPMTFAELCWYCADRALIIVWIPILCVVFVVFTLNHCADIMLIPHWLCSDSGTILIASTRIKWGRAMQPDVEIKPQRERLFKLKGDFGKGFSDTETW